MKQINLKPVFEINLSDLTDRMYIGVQFKDGQRAFVMKLNRTDYVLARPFIPSDDFIDLHSFKSISEAVRCLGSTENAFVFNTKEELLNWLIGLGS